jgi:opacity protein-like surface antigen
MQKLLCAALLVTLAAPSALATDIVTFKAKNGNVTFNHGKHSEQFACKACHEKTPPGKMALSKETAHKLCQGCHQTKGRGPTQCGQCHRK